MPELISYTEEFSVQDTDVDFGGWMKPSALLRYTQQIATDHSWSMGMDDAFYKRIQCVYLLGKQSLEFVRVPRRKERLTFVSIPERSRRGANKRVTLVKDEAGQNVALVDSRWILVDTVQNRIIRRPTEQLEHSWNEQVPDELPQTMPKAQQLLEGGVRRADYSLCDSNGHINNTCYLDLACDLLPLEEVRQHPVRRASVRYHREVPVGECVQLQYGPVEGGWYILGQRDGQHAFEAFCGF